MIRKIGLIAGQNFSGWHRNARIWLTFALGLVLCLMLSDQMLTRAQTYDASIQIFEPLHLDLWRRGVRTSVHAAPAGAFRGHAFYRSGGALPSGTHDAGDLAGRPGGVCGACGDGV